MRVQELIDYYKREVKTIDQIIANAESRKYPYRAYYRIDIKRECYHTFIHELSQLNKLDYDPEWETPKQPKPWNKDL